MAGTKRKRGKNSWRLEYMYDNERYSCTIKANSASEANRKLALFVAEVEKGSYSKDSNLTFVEMAQMFLDKYANSNLSKTTVKNYKSQLNKYILQEIGMYKLSKLKRIHIQEFANKLYEEYDLSSKTINNYIKLISSILTKAIEWDYLQNNVATNISIPKNFNKQKKKVILYSYDEVNQFLTALENLEDKELQLAIYSSFVIGGRRGEILALTFADFNFYRCTVDLNKNYVSINGGTETKEIKNNKNRLMYVPRFYIEKVKEYYKYLKSTDLNTKLFNMHPNTYTNKFKLFLADNNLRAINLKDLRALNESILVNRGLDIVDVAKRLGHLPSTATNYYLDQIPEEDKKASKVLEGLLQ